MKIKNIEVWQEDFELVRPYKIAFRTVNKVSNMIVKIITDGKLIGLGAASPEKFVTGESFETCRKSLENVEWLQGKKITGPWLFQEEIIKNMPNTPAAQAAVDMALYDLWAQKKEMPLAVAL